MQDHFGLDYSHHYLCVCVIMHYMIVSGRNLIVKLCFSIFASLHLCLCICVFVFVYFYLYLSTFASVVFVCIVILKLWCVVLLLISEKQPICSSKSKQNNCTQNCPIIISFANIQNKIPQMLRSPPTQSLDNV